MVSWQDEFQENNDRSVWDGFILDQHQLIPTAKETWNGIKVVIRAVTDQAGTSFRVPLLVHPFLFALHDVFSVSDSIASTLPPITLATWPSQPSPPPPPTTTTTTTTTTTPAPTTTTWTTTAPWTPELTTTIPFSSIFIVTEPTLPTLTTPTHLDAFYKLGKRRFKFVSIKTFHPTTTPLPVTAPAFHSLTTASFSFPEQQPAPPSQLFTVVGPNENNEVIDEFEGGRGGPRVLPAFVRRPGVVRTVSPTPAPLASLNVVL